MPLRFAGSDEIVVIGSSGQPVQQFVILEGRITGDLHLSDGTAVFGRQKP